MAAAELAELRADSTALEISEAREPLAVAASLDKLAITDEASAATEEAREATSEAPPEAREPAAEVSEAMAEEPPPTMDVMSAPREDARDSSWALATPAARKVVATTEKRILIDWAGLDRLEGEWKSG